MWRSLKRLLFCSVIIRSVFPILILVYIRSSSVANYSIPSNHFWLYSCRTLPPEAQYLDINGCLWVQPAFSIAQKTQSLVCLCCSGMLKHISCRITLIINCITVAHLVQATHQYVAIVELINIFLARVKGNLFTSLIKWLKPPEE
jgi:hypothetical protein